MKTLCFILLLIMLGELAVTASIHSEKFESPSANFHPQAGRPIPNVELPEHIVAPEGKLTLVADFNAASEKGVPLYVVNRTGKPVEFRAQDSDIYLMLEYQHEDGTWERAKAHRVAWCGNSYHSLTLHPGRHLVVQGYMPQQGEKARVRFVCFYDESLISNESDGWILFADVAEARIDGLARRMYWVLSNPWEEYGDKPFGPFISLEQRVATLRLIQSYENNFYYRIAAEKTATKWEENPSSTAEEKKAAKALREILAQPWTKKRDANALRQRCIEALKGERSNNFGMPENEPAMVWAVLRDLADDPKLDIPGWKPVIDLAIKQGFTKKNVPEVGGAIGVIAVPRIADEFLPNSFFESHLVDYDLQQADAQSSWARMHQVCAYALARRGEYERLVELGWKLSPQSQLAVFSALAHPGNSSIQERYYLSEKEEAFWRHCLKTQTLQAVYQLRSGQSSEHNSFNHVVHAPLREYWLNEAERNRALTEDFELGEQFYMFRMAVEFLASFKKEGDTPVFEKLLEYRGYKENKGTRGDGKSFVERHYAVREAAKRALLQRGIPVPQDLVLKIDVTNDQ